MQRLCLSAAVKRDDAVTLGIAHLVGKNGSPGFSVGGALDVSGQAVPVEDVVPKNQGRRCTAQKLSSDQKGLRNAVGAGLGGIVQFEPPSAAVTQQSFEARLLVWRRDDKNLSDSSQHQYRQWIV